MPRRKGGPGPGAYNIPNGFGSQVTKAYTMRIRPGDAKAIDVTPGPAGYEPNTTHALKASAKWGFGTSQRNPMNKNAAPGPGEYTPFDPNIISPRACFGTSKRPGANKNNLGNPGPGSYNPLRVTDTVHLSATIAGVRDEGLKMQQKSPGPAAYNQSIGSQATAQKPPSWGFGTAARLTSGAGGNTGLLNPGPGSYEAKPTFHGPKISITPRREPYEDF